MFEVKIKNENGTVIYSPCGELDTTTSKEFADMIDYESCDIMEFNFEEVSYITSAGIRLIISSAITMGEKKGSFYLRNINQDVDKVLKMTGIYNIVEVRND